MSRSVEEITALLAERRGWRGALIEQARRISAQYNNKIVIPGPDLDDAEGPAVANLIAQGIDQHGMRIASSIPNIECPPVKPGETFERRAKVRRQAAYGWMETNGFDLMLRKRSRHLIAYAATPVYLRPDPKLRGPRWDVKSPLDTYPAATMDPLDMEPADCIFTFARSIAWLRRQYPAQYAVLRASVSKAGYGTHDDDQVELAQYCDDTEIVLVAMGSGRIVGPMAGWRTEAEYGINGETIVNLSGAVGGKDWAIELSRVPNLAGLPPVVMPGRISLDTPKGQFDDTVGLFQLQARLMALEVNAVAKAVFPETWITWDAQAGGKVIREADGLRGVVGEIQGGRLDTVQMQPGFQTMNAVNYIERSIRQDSQIPAEFGGESPTNIRTDRRGQSVLSAQTDFFVDEAQRILARSIKAEMDRAVAIDLAYYGPERKSFYVQWGGAPGRVDYTPEQVWTEDRTMFVNFSLPGLDANAQTVYLGQQLGLGVKSRETVMEQLPDISDVKKERNRVYTDHLDDALRAQLMQPGAVTVPDLARMQYLLATTDKTMAEVVLQVQAEAQARQATAGPPGTPEAPVAPGSPEAQPGLAPPGAGAEAGVAPPPQGLDNLRSLLSGLTAGRGIAGAAYNQGGSANHAGVA